MLNMFRTIIGDSDGTTYTDERITQLLNASAFMVSAELEACSAVSKPSASVCMVDVTTTLPNYPSFANLVLLKSLCILDQGVARTRFSTEGIKVVAGPVSLQVSSGGTSGAYNLLSEFGPCKAYEKLREDLCFRAPMQTAEYCKQILGPFISAEFDPSRGSGSGYTGSTSSRS